MMTIVKRTCLIAAQLCCAAVGFGQQAFELDPSFEFSGVNEFFVASLLPLSNGGLILAGQMKDPPGLPLATYGLLQTTGTGQLDLSYDHSNLGNGKITPWNNLFYVLAFTAVRRVDLDGINDNSWALGTTAIPYFSPLQGGDYHVYPDGRILMTGLHILQDSIRGFVGGYNLIWFTNTGYLDTTKTHRKGDGVIYRIEEQNNGKFLVNGFFTEYEDQPTSAIIRIHPDGELDTNFNSPIFWGDVLDFHTLPNGKILAAGGFKYNINSPDTMGLIRLHPDGSLDTSFHIPEFQKTYHPSSWLRVISIYPLDAGRLILTGYFDYVDGQPRGGICMIDTAGNLLNDYFTGPGVGGWQNGQVWTQQIRGIVPAPDGSYYIFGSYHGYDDGSNNYSGQRMVSRLYGLNVGVEEDMDVPSNASLSLQPNPGVNWTAVNYYRSARVGNAFIVLRDMSGRELQRHMVVDIEGQLVLDLRAISAGMYSIELVDNDRMIESKKLVVERSR